MIAEVAPELVEAFDRDGFVVVPDLLDARELETFGEAVDAAVAARTRSDGRAFAEKSRYEQSFVQCTNLWEDHPGVRPLTFHPRVGRAAAELLGTTSVRLWHDQALYKEEDGGPTDPHQDQPYWPIAETDTVTGWIPFERSTIESGCMGYVPGSHKLGLARFVNIFGREAPDNLLDDPLLTDIEPVFVEVPPGAVAFHHGLTVHLAHPNSSGRVRRVHTIIYFRDGCTRGSPAFHPSVDRPGIVVGAPIDGDLTPIVWPRDADDVVPIPAPPPPWLHEVASPGVLPGA